MSGSSLLRDARLEPRGDPHLEQRPPDDEGRGAHDGDPSARSEPGVRREPDRRSTRTPVRRGSPAAPAREAGTAGACASVNTMYSAASASTRGRRDDQRREETGARGCADPERSRAPSSRGARSIPDAGMSRLGDRADRGAVAQGEVLMDVLEQSDHRPVWPSRAAAANASPGEPNRPIISTSQGAHPATRPSTRCTVQAIVARRTAIGRRMSAAVEDDRVERTDQGRDRDEPAGDAARRIDPRRSRAGGRGRRSPRRRSGPPTGSA